MLQCIVEPRPLVSAILETSEVVVCVPWVFSLIVFRERIQWSAILIAVSRNNTNNVWVQAHNDPSITCWDTSSIAVGDDTGGVIGPTIEIES